MDKIMCGVNKMVQPHTHTLVGHSEFYEKCFLSNRQLPKKAQSVYIKYENRHLCNLIFKKSLKKFHYMYNF